MIETKKTNDEDVKTADAVVVPDRVKVFMETNFPDRKFNDDKEFNGGVADYLEDSYKRLKSYELADETIRSVARNHPELLDIVEDLAADKGMSFAEAIARNLDPEEVFPKEGDPDFAKMRQAHEQRVARCNESDTYKKEIDENLEESSRIVNDYFQSQSMSKEQAQSFADYIDSIMENYVKGRISVEVLDMFRNAMNYDKDVAEARMEGVIDGKNAKVDAVRKQNADATDGMPSAGSSIGTMTPPQPQRRRIIDTAAILGISDEELEQRRKNQQ